MRRLIQFLLLATNHIALFIMLRSMNPQKLNFIRIIWCRTISFVFKTRYESAGVQAWWGSACFIYFN